MLHSTRKVCDEIFWVGADDRRTHLFENIHPIPEGVSYNSYLIASSEVTALIDTVDWSACRAMIENVEHLLDGRSLDLLVVCHMEPDHSASIAEVMLRWPDVKIASSAKAFEMMKGFGISLEGRTTIELKEGSTLSAAGHELKFFGAPMVHWPEVVVALDTTSGTFFSADAFGTFTTLDGRLFSDEIDFDHGWIDEARRYYANIVGKYGGPVQALLKKVSPHLSSVNFIAPLHGPVWRAADMRTIIGKTDLWSRCEPERSGALIVYASMYGTTESAVAALASRIADLGATDLRVRDVSKTHVSYLIADAFKYSHLIVASPTYNGEIFPLIKNFLEDAQALGLTKRTVGLIGSGSWAPNAGGKLRDFFEREMKEMTVVDPLVALKPSATGDSATAIESLASAIASSIKERSC